MMTALNILYSFFISFKALAGFKQAKACRFINIDFLNANLTTIKLLSNSLKINVDKPFKSSDYGGHKAVGFINARLRISVFGLSYSKATYIFIIPKLQHKLL